LRGGAGPIIESGAASAGVGLSARDVVQLERYVDLVVEWSARLRLTGARSREEVARVLVADGLGVVPVLPPAGAFADLGSGAGVPGLLVAVFRPVAHVTLVEASRKKAGFLEIAVRTLGLANVAVICARAEELGRDPVHREHYDVVTARAVGDLRVLAEYALPMLRLGGIGVFPKGSKAAQEIEAAARALSVLGGVVELRSAGASQSASLVILRKTIATPQEYPRRTGTPERRPLR